jgi:hypothetical protein
MILQRLLSLDMEKQLLTQRKSFPCPAFSCSYQNGMILTKELMQAVEMFSNSSWVSLHDPDSLLYAADAD